MTNILTVAQAAVALGVSPRMVRHLIAVGTLPAARHGRDWLLRPADVERAKDRPKVGRPRKT